MLSVRALHSIQSLCLRNISFSEKGAFFRLEKAGAVAEIIMDRPTKLNTMNDGYIAELTECMKIVDSSADINAAILWAEGKHFSAGLDLKDMMSFFLEDASPAQRAMFGVPESKEASERGMPAMRNVKFLRLVERYQAAVTALERCRVPVIAAIHGKCIGGAVDLVTAADIRMCTKDVDICIKETEVAIVADMGTFQRLGKLVGRGVAREMAFTGQSMLADRALKCELVNHVYESKEEMLAAARKMAARIASFSPLTVQGAKHILNYSDEHTVADGLHHVALWNSAFLKSDDILQVGASMFTKKKPQFKNILIPEAEGRVKKNKKTSK